MAAQNGELITSGADAYYSAAEAATTGSFLSGSDLSFSSAIFAIPGELLSLGISGGDAVAPVVTNLSPTNGTVISNSQSISFDITDNLGLFTRIVVFFRYPNKGISEVAFDSDGNGLTGAYTVSPNSSGTISQGWHLNFLRSGSWPDTSVNMDIHGIDTSGNESSIVNYFWTIQSYFIPTLLNFQPAVGANLAPTGSIQFDVSDVGPLKRVIIVATYPSSTAAELVHDGTSFTSPYNQNSSRTSIASGFHYTIFKNSTWPGSVTLTPYAMDILGGENT